MCMCGVPAQDLLVEVFTAEIPTGAVEESEVQEPLATAQAVPDCNIQLDGTHLKVSGDATCVAANVLEPVGVASLR